MKCKIKKGEILRELCARVYTHNEPFIETERIVFALVKNIDKNQLSVLLGPATYINHDCKNNSKIYSMCKDMICIEVIETVRLRQEITINYGPDYFGPRNSQCACVS